MLFGTGESDLLRKTESPDPGHSYSAQYRTRSGGLENPHFDLNQKQRISIFKLESGVKRTHLQFKQDPKQIETLYLFHSLPFED